MIKKKTVRSFCMGLAVIPIICILTSCSVVKEKSPEQIKVLSDEYIYSYNRPFAGDEYVDEYMTIDGKLDEDVWQNVNFDIHGEHDVTIKAGTYFTDTGLYYAAVATDSKITHTHPFDFDNNSSFRIVIVSEDSFNDVNGYNITETASEPKEKRVILVDSKNTQSAGGLAVYSETTATDNSLTVELFITWDDLQFGGRQENVRINTYWRKVKRENSDDNHWVDIHGYPDSESYYAMRLFNEKGSVSESGTLLNKSENTLGVSPFGYAAGDRWDLSGDTAENEVRTAKSTFGAHQIIFLNDAESGDFEFEATLSFDPDAISKERKAGLLLVDRGSHYRTYVTYPGMKSLRWGNTIKGMYGLELLQNTVYIDGSDKITLKIVSRDSLIEYYYRYSSDSDYVLAYTETKDFFSDEVLSVGFYASSNTTFTDWRYESYSDGSIIY